ncbi:hypothetical protein SAMN06265374_2120 [Roseibium denhamense]|uniref:Uncharacterized protein n=1 Tax=Roseibium denhamense TaxID=76305 RepID=A0ABY1NX39_9HYPH|nr:hypothetical protein SAMN06265374_2120 [Roseibium denhamense]
MTASGRERFCPKPSCVIQCNRLAKARKELLNNGICASQLKCWISQFVIWTCCHTLSAMFTVIHTQTKLVLKSQHKLPQLGLACCALLPFYGAWTAEPHDTAGQVGMSLAGIVFLATGRFFFPNHTIVFDKGAGNVVSERRRLGRTNRQVIGLARIERVYAERTRPMTHRPSGWRQEPQPDVYPLKPRSALRAGVSLSRKSTIGFRPKSTSRAVSVLSEIAWPSKSGRDTSGPKRTFDHAAAKVRSEPSLTDDTAAPMSAS